jgi:hypothetical protein
MEILALSGNRSHLNLQNQQEHFNVYSIPNTSSVWFGCFTASTQRLTSTRTFSTNCTQFIPELSAFNKQLISCHYALLEQLSITYDCSKSSTFWVVTQVRYSDVSEQPVRHIFKGQAIHEDSSYSTAWSLKMGPTGCPETSVSTLLA